MMKPTNPLVMDTTANLEHRARKDFNTDTECELRMKNLELQGIAIPAPTVIAMVERIIFVTVEDTKSTVKSSTLWDLQQSSNGAVYGTPDLYFPGKTPATGSKMIRVRQQMYGLFEDTETVETFGLKASFFSYLLLLKYPQHEVTATNQVRLLRELIATHPKSETMLPVVDRLAKVFEVMNEFLVSDSATADSIKTTAPLEAREASSSTNMPPFARRIPLSNVIHAHFGLGTSV